MEKVEGILTSGTKKVLKQNKGTKFCVKIWNQIGSSIKYNLEVYSTTTIKELKKMVQEKSVQ